MLKHEVFCSQHKRSKSVASQDWADDRVGKVLLLCKHEDSGFLSNIQVKPKARCLAPTIQGMAERGDAIPRVCWPASLAESLSARFSNRLHLKNGVKND